MNKLKVLHVVPSYIPAYRYGGSIPAAHELCVNLAGSGVDVSVYTTNIDGNKDLDVPLGSPVMLDGVKVTYFRVEFPRWYCYSKDLSRAIESNIRNFDLLHIHSVFTYPTFTACRLCRKFKIPYVIDPHGALDPDLIKFKSPVKKMLYMRLIERRNVTGAAAILPASSLERENLLSLGFGSSSIVVPKGINISMYDKGEGMRTLRDRYPVLNGKKIILFLGRVHRKKGFDLLSEALRTVFKKRGDAYLVVAGPGGKGYINKVKASFRRRCIADKVIFTGMLSGADKIDAFYSSDIFVLPSYGENFAIAVLEAMACRLPVVISDRVGLGPDVKEYGAGLVTGCDAQEIATAILKLLDDDKLRTAMGRRGRALAEERFVWGKVVDKVIGVYNTILTRSP